MAKLGFSFQMQLAFSEPVSRHAFTLRCLPQSSSRQQVLSAAVSVMPDCRITLSEDGFGLKQYGAIAKAHAGFSVQAEGVVSVSADNAEQATPLWQLGPYRRFTPLTAPGPQLLALAAALPEGRVPEAIMAMLGKRFSYLPGSTTAVTTAEQAAAAAGRVNHVTVFDTEGYVP